MKEHNEVKYTINIDADKFYEDMRWLRKAVEDAVNSFGCRPQSYLGQLKGSLMILSEIKKLLDEATAQKVQEIMCGILEVWLVESIDSGILSKDDVIYFLTALDDECGNILKEVIK